MSVPGSSGATVALRGDDRRQMTPAARIATAAPRTTTTSTVATALIRSSENLTRRERRDRRQHPERDQHAGRERGGDASAPQPAGDAPGDEGGGSRLERGEDGEQVPALVGRCQDGNHERREHGGGAAAGEHGGPVGHREVCGGGSRRRSRSRRRRHGRLGDLRRRLGLAERARDRVGDPAAVVQRQLRERIAGQRGDRLVRVRPAARPAPRPRPRGRGRTGSSPRRRGPPAAPALRRAAARRGCARCRGRPARRRPTCRASARASRRAPRRTRSRRARRPRSSRPGCGPPRPSRARARAPR